jgi:4-methylaminobutanoate oxidase (formaldehyde-forming)
MIGHGAESGPALSKKYIKAGTWEVDVAGVRYPAEVSIQPMYDPKNARIKV